MRVFSLFLALFLMVGCASKPDYYISPVPVAIPATATYWIDTFNVEVEGKNERFLSDEKVREKLQADLVARLLDGKRYASSKESADYLLDIDAVYARRIQDTQGGLMNKIVADGTYLASVDFNYQVKVKKSGAEVLHFAQAREGLMPAGPVGQFHAMKGIAGAFTKRGNSDIENYYTSQLSRFIVDDLQAIPSR